MRNARTGCQWFDLAWTIGRGTNPSRKIVRAVTESVRLGAIVELCVRPKAACRVRVLGMDLQRKGSLDKTIDRTIDNNSIKSNQRRLLSTTTNISRRREYRADPELQNNGNMGDRGRCVKNITTKGSLKFQSGACKRSARNRSRHEAAGPPSRKQGNRTRSRSQGENLTCWQGKKYALLEH